MLNEKNVLGKTFRRLRKSRKMSISVVSKQITSRSSLQRWENNEGEMSVEKVIKLLKRIHIQPQEYIELLVMSSFDFDIAELEVAYRENNIKLLKELVIILLEKHSNNLQDVQLLFEAAVACNFYYDLSNIDLFPSEEKIRLKLYFSSIDEWTRENVIFFANVQLYLSSSDIYTLAQSLFSYLIEQPDTNKFYMMAIDALINAVFALIKKKSLDKAIHMLKRLEYLNLSTKYSGAKVRIEFMEILIDCICKKDTISMYTFINNLNAVGLLKEAENYKFTFHQIFESYHILID